MGIIEDRRALHRIPELDRDLPETLSYIHNSLLPLSCRVEAPMEGALCAWFDFGADRAIAFRADCDGLPLHEQSDKPYCSTHPGKMHACGHDGHTAIALELARRLSEKKSLNCNVLLVFQPAEESTGGARDLCETGIFEKYRIEAIFGLHLWPGLPKGQIFSRANELMSRSCEINVDIFGRSAHIGRSWEGVDALAAGLEFYRRAVAMEQALPEHIFRLLKFGKFTSGHVRNAISDHTRIEGSLRAFQDEIFDGLRSGLDQIAAEVEAQFGCTVSITNSTGYPAVMNPQELCQAVGNIVPFEPLDEPSMTSEDFSFYQRRLPGMFFFLGLGDAPALHSADFDFDEGVLIKGADFFEKIAEGWV